MVFKAEIVSLGWELDYGTILPFVPALPELKASGSFPTLSASHPIVTLLHATGVLPIMVCSWGGQPQWWVGWKFCDGRTNTLLIITDAHDQNKEKLWKLKKNLLDWCISFVSEVSGCVVLGKQASWVDLKGLCLWDIDRGTWRRAVEGLGWPSLQWMLRKTFHLALDWVTQRFAIASLFQTKHLGLSY